MYDELTLLEPNGKLITRISTKDNVTDKLLRYLLGWCVQDTPEQSPKLVEKCAEFGCTTLRQTRYVWIKYVVCITDDELEALVRKIMQVR